MAFKRNYEKFTAKTKGVYEPYKEIFQLFLIPLVLAIIPIIWPNKIGTCAFVVLLMSVYWIVQCVPIAVTSLLPTILYPLFGIMSSEDVSALYFNVRITFNFYKNDYWT